MCSAGFERVPGGLYLGTCAGCNCNGHATACDPISGQCLVKNPKTKKKMSQTIVSALEDDLFSPG